MDAPRPREPSDGAEPFWDLLDALLPLEDDALDVATGTGRVALHVAPRVSRVVGVDIDANALEAARWDATRRGIGNATFVRADATDCDLAALLPDARFVLVTARLFHLPQLVARIHDALAPGGAYVAEILEGRNWHEAGGSRWNQDAGTVQHALRAAGFRIHHARVEETARVFDGADAAREYLKDRRQWVAWRRDGRWDAWKTHARRHGWTLTDARLVFDARKPA